MPRKGLRFPAISVVSLSVATLCGLLWCSVPSIARADSVKFVAHDDGNAFTAAAKGVAEQPAKATTGKSRLDAAGLMNDDDSDVSPTPVISSHALAAVVFSDVSGRANASREPALANLANAFDAGSNRDDAFEDSGNSATSQWPGSFYGVAGFSFYPGAPVTAASSGQTAVGAGSDPIDLGTAHAGDGAADSSSSDGGQRDHNSVAPRISWAARILASDPVAVPEPSSLLLLGCGMFALALKRKYRSAN
jgi:hypothetical protein